MLNEKPIVEMVAVLTDHESQVTLGNFKFQTVKGMNSSYGACFEENIVIKNVFGL